ncbi:cytochrome c biogenesis protein [Planctomycetes bacterium K23_9]|uniref:Cytochrome c biogenesis protein CcsA n=1 Tax=Stieleria marina TaxID=1930275 RepID=A0A517NP79_9BACT|nr:Cytochrome c biogenesis protein CcsA [Planctomycetes bacterium K23_9]
MATASTTPYADDARPEESLSISSGIIGTLASLKLTVALFAFSLVIVLVGTLAQDEMNMFEVKQRYFTSWIAMMHVDDFFPQAFFPHDKPLRLRIPFPGGALIGLMLMVNLVAAKATRFRVHAGGTRLAAGICLIALGVLVAALIVSTGHSSDGLQGNPPEWLGYSGLWRCCQVAMGVGAVASVLACLSAKHRLLRTTSIVLTVILTGLLIYTVVNDYRIGDPGLRIVWQLSKGLGAGVILLAGCLLIFAKQGGNVLLHLGVALLMFGQFVFGDRQLEQRLSLVEGQSSNALINLDEVELTFINTVGDEDIVVAVPGSRLRQAANDKNKISDPSLPVDVAVVRFLENSQLKRPGKENLATQGLGLEVEATEQRKSGGAESSINVVSAYIELFGKGTDDSLGTHLVSQWLSDNAALTLNPKTPDDYDKITANDKEYKVGLRYHREVKPYWVQLEDVRRVTYSGTDTPRDYSSFIRIVDPVSGEDRRERVWMNNPLRFRGETYFQSSYESLPNGKEWTSLQVVRNSGWLIPYVACSITALGMLVHFFGTLQRFLSRREREMAKQLTPHQPPLPVYASVAVYSLIALGMLQPWKATSYGIVGPTPTDKQTEQPADKDDAGKTKDAGAEFDFATAGAIPVQFGGRVMPLDAYARQTLKAMSNKETLPLDGVPDGFKTRIGEDAKKISAMQWLMEVAIDEPKIRYVPMFRIDAEEVRSELGVSAHKTKLYSLNDIGENWQRVDKLIKAAGGKDNAERSFKEKKLIELDLRTRNYTLASASFQLPLPEAVPENLPPQISREQAQVFMIQELEKRLEALKQMRSPNIIPPTAEVAKDVVDNPQWSAFGPAFFDDAKASIQGGGSDDSTRPGVKTFGKMISAYGDNDPVAFNKAVTDHLGAVQSYAIPGYQPRLVSLERWMQTKWPTGQAMFLYLATFVLGLVYLATGLPRLRRAIWGMLVITFVIHTIAIACRIMITQRAPVINIYSSAVFIGWAAVGFGLIIESIYRRGLGNLLAAVAGTLTLLVAYGLSLNTGDTMPVLEAVLDTQFWLTTHVISVSLGYVATLVAGFFGIGYLLTNWIGAKEATQRQLYRCCYGTACFGILFSFVGTLLGGLWADDSWGRFWGWDPKENGALLIVIWNALMLHARWDGMVKARGFSVLAIGGNIVTAWSWFGTNELGIGKHSYGFTSGVLFWLTVFVVSQLAFIIAGMAFSRKPPTPAA